MTQQSAIDCLTIDELREQLSIAIQMATWAENTTMHGKLDAHVKKLHATIVAREAAEDVFKPRFVADHVIRACHHCRTQYAKRTATPEGHEYVEAAIIICVACIERMVTEPS